MDARSSPHPRARARPSVGMGVPARSKQGRITVTHSKRPPRGSSRLSRATIGWGALLRSRRSRSGLHGPRRPRATALRIRAPGCSRRGVNGQDAALAWSGWGAPHFIAARGRMVATFGRRVRPRPAIVSSDPRTAVAKTHSRGDARRHRGVGVRQRMRCADSKPPPTLRAHRFNRAGRAHVGRPRPRRCGHRPQDWLARHAAVAP